MVWWRLLITKSAFQLRQLRKYYSSSLPVSCESPAPIRTRILSTGNILADEQATKLPTCAIKTLRQRICNRYLANKFQAVHWHACEVALKAPEVSWLSAQVWSGDDAEPLVRAERGVVWDETDILHRLQARMTSLANVSSVLFHSILFILHSFSKLKILER